MTFHVSFLSLDFSQNDLCLTVFLTEGKRVFRLLILSLVRSGNVFVYGRLSYGQASTYRPHPTYYVTVLVFVCPYVRTTLANSKNWLKNISQTKNLRYLSGLQCVKNILVQGLIKLRCPLEIYQENQLIGCSQ